MTSSYNDVQKHISSPLFPFPEDQKARKSVFIPQIVYTAEVRLSFVNLERHVLLQGRMFEVFFLAGSLESLWQPGSRRNVQKVMDTFACNSCVTRASRAV